jgi:hypothetical protein
MREPDFDEMDRQMLVAGVSPRVVQRTVGELRDHYEDLRSELLGQGVSVERAAHVASQQLGDLDRIARQAASKPELRRWSYRYPALGRFALPFLCVAALPVAPLIAGVQHAHTLVRWGAILTLSALITASLFLAMQTAISVG